MTSLNILVKTMSFYSESFHRYGALKNVHCFGPSCTRNPHIFSAEVQPGASKIVCTVLYDGDGVVIIGPGADYAY